MVTYHHVKSKLVLVVSCIGFLIGSMAYAQKWELKCLLGSEVQILGTGMGTRDGVTHNPAIIPISNPSEVDSIIAQLVIKVPEESLPPTKVVISTATETHQFNNPTTTIVGAGWFYECKLGPAPSVTARVTGTGSATYKSPRAFVVYVFRKNSIGNVQIGKLMHKSLWWDADDRPKTFTETFTIPASLAPRTIRVTFVVTDKDNTTNRNVLLKAKAGDVQQSASIFLPSHGNELLIHTITLNNVLAQTTSVSATVGSPDGTGDSVYWSGIDIQAPCEGDLGDAPDPTFPTLLANQGAFHYYKSNFFLGTLFDAEVDGQPTALADGDDFHALDDEDGVVFTSALTQGLPATVDVTATAPGILNAWIDFEGNGTWSDAMDQVFINKLLVAGVNHLNFLVPVTMKPNITAVCRFRFSSQPSLLYTGMAPDGEVEDYVIDILTPVELTSFSASTQLNSIVIEWVTQSESENLGFLVFRSESELGNFVEITPQLIKGAGSSSARNSYRFIDVNVQPNQSYYYQLASVSYKGLLQMHGYVKVELKRPTSFTLDQNSPNPFNQKTRIAYSIKEAGDATLFVFNLQGQLVRTLVSQHLTPGTYSVLWDGRDDKGLDLPTGTYIYTLKAGSTELNSKMTLVR